MMLSVVIATKDRAAYLERALASLAVQQTTVPYEVVVADNGSRDATPEIAERHARATHREPGAGGLVHYVRVPEPNRGAARNAGVARANGTHVVFVDDDVAVPPAFLAAHGAAHADGRRSRVVSGPILNVPTDHERPSPSLANYSGAFFCTCNVSLPKAAFEAAGGFDERFDLYGWEDTELGLRLRREGLGHRFAWNAYLYHIKPPRDETLAVVLRKTVERARMAARLLELHDGWRATLATGAYGANVARARLIAPPARLAWFAGVATSPRAPAPVRALARGQLLDGAYVHELERALRGRRD